MEVTILNFFLSLDFSRFSTEPAKTDDWLKQNSRIPSATNNGHNFRKITLKIRIWHFLIPYSKIVCCVLYFVYPMEETLIYQRLFKIKRVLSSIYHSINLPIDAEVAEKFLNAYAIGGHSVLRPDATLKSKKHLYFRTSIVPCNSRLVRRTLQREFATINNYFNQSKTPMSFS